jgi:hypothetical protein
MPAPGARAAAHDGIYDPWFIVKLAGSRPALRVAQTRGAEHLQSIVLFRSVNLENIFAV